MGNRLPGLSFWHLCPPGSAAALRLEAGEVGAASFGREGKVLLMVSPQEAGTSFVQVPETTHAALEVTAGLQGAELARNNAF